MKKKFLTIIMTVALSMAMLAACGKNSATDVGQSDVEQNGIENVGNPWVESDAEGVQEATGLTIYTPAEATNARYSFLETDDMAQVVFDYDGHADWTFRKQKTDKLIDISGMYYEWVYQGSALVSGREAVEYAYAEEADDSGMIDDLFGVQVINWYDDASGITYSLSVSGTDLNGMDIQVIAENLFTLENE